MARRDATVSAAASLGAAFALGGCGDHAVFTPRANALHALAPLTVARRSAPLTITPGSAPLTVTPRLAPTVPRTSPAPIREATLSAAIAPRRIVLPHAETGGHLGASPRMLMLQFAARAGQVLEIRLDQAGAVPVVAVEPGAGSGDAAQINGLAPLAAAVPEGARRPAELRVLIVDDALAAPRHAELAAAPAGASEFFLRLPADADYVVELRPPGGGPYRLALELLAPLPFPVPGYDYTAIRSFFGASRESGKRRHEGVDIFVPRLTPVVAVADGVVGLHVEGRGGIAVVLSIAGISYYYAHLDRTAVGDGQRVRVGDVLGYVGSTGNARGSAPHLHFGVYEFGKGAVDPLPLLEERRFAAADETSGVEIASEAYPGDARTSAGDARASGGIAGGGVEATAQIAAVAGGCGANVLADASATAAVAAGSWSFGGEVRFALAPNGAAVLCTDGT